MRKAGFALCGVLALGLLVARGIPAQDKEKPKEGDLAQVVKTLQVNFDFEATPLRDAVSYLQTSSAINIVLDPHMDRSFGERLVTLTLKDVTLATALDLLLGKDLAYVVKDEVVVITNRDGQTSAPAAEANPPSAAEAAGRAILKKDVDVAYEATPLADVVSYLRHLTKANIVFDPYLTHPDVRKKLITLTLHDVTLASALDVILGKDLTYVVKENVIVITEKSGK